MTRGRTARYQRRQSGAVFVVTLVVLATIVAIVASVATTSRMAFLQETNRLERQRARIAAEAAIQRAVECFSDASQSGSTTNPTSAGVQGNGVNQPGSTTLQDDWSTLGTQGNDRFVLNDSSFRMQIIDAASLVNLNTATLAQLQNLPLDQEHIDALLDWRTAGETARPDGGKDSYYNNLQNPYDASLRNLASISELLDIRYFTPADLYDPPTMTSTANIVLPPFPDGRTPVLADLITVDSVGMQVSRTGGAKTNLNAATTNQQTLQRFGLPMAMARNIVRNRPRPAGYTGWAQLLRMNAGLSTANLRSLLNNCTVGASTQPGKINLNTATAAVLQTLPNVTPDIAQSIVSQQSSGFTQLGDILTIPGLSTVRAVQGIVDDFTVKSSTFLVRVIGTAGHTQVPMEAILTVTNNSAKVLRMEEQPFSDMTGRWGWAASPTNDVNLEAGS